jgi:hypothetical protein
MDTDTLLTLSEVAVAFAGFASVASAINRRYSTTDPRVNALRLHNMVDFSLTVVFVSLVPVFLRHIVENESWLWIIASGCSLAYAIPLAIRMTRRNRELESTPDYDNAGARRLQFMAGLASTCLIVGLTGIAADYAETLYLACALTVLAISGILFMRVIQSLLFFSDGVQDKTGASPD